jgi:hypothetical protein
MSVDLGNSHIKDCTRYGMYHLWKEKGSNDIPDLKGRAGEVIQ